MNEFVILKVGWQRERMSMYPAFSWQTVPLGNQKRKWGKILFLLYYS